MDSLRKYKALPGGWFKEGTEVVLIEDFRPEVNGGIFEGVRVCKYPLSELHEIGEEYLDEEICYFDDFEEVKA